MFRLSGEAASGRAKGEASVLSLFCNSVLVSQGVEERFGFFFLWVSIARRSRAVVLFLFFSPSVLVQGGEVQLLG